MIRVGQGIDVHPFDDSRPLILGGVRISDNGGLAGHSDADAVLHAVTDALLGAAGAGDIGQYFPSEDPKWKGVDSSRFVREGSIFLGLTAFGSSKDGIYPGAESQATAGYRSGEMVRDGLGLF